MLRQQWCGGAILACVLSLPSLTARAQTSVPDGFDPPSWEARRRVRAARAQVPPLIDGVVTDSVWLAAPSAGAFVQVEPVQGGAATHETDVRVAFDDDALYVSARLEQPGGFWAFNQRSLRRDFSGDESDAFGVMLDTFGDGRNAFSFQVNPWGAQRDMQVVDDSLFEDKWDTVWRSATRRDETGWTVELAIPWKSLRFGPPGTKWGIQFSRRERGINEDTAWSPHPRNVSDWRMSYAGALEGLETPPPRALSLQVRPYGIARVEKVDGSEASLAPSLGGEVTWSPTESTVFDLTANTDFAETDVDRRVVNLSRFSVFFPERRQFFLESAGVFASGTEGLLQPFFSRAIGLSETGEPVPISIGARGVYRTTQRSAGALFAHTMETHDSPSAVFGVGRYSHNLGEQSRVGAMLVARHDFDREGDVGRTNIVPVVDGLARFGPFTVTASAMGSSTSGGSAAHFGAAGSVEANVQGNWGRFSLRGLGISPQFEARSGFLARPDIVGAGASGGLDVRPAWLPKMVRSVGPALDAYALFGSGDGRFQEATIYFSPLWVLFSGGDEAWLFVEKSAQVLGEGFEPVPGVSFAPRQYDFERVGVGAYSQASRKGSVGAEASAGSFYSAAVFRGSVWASIQPIPHVGLSANYGYNRFWGAGVEGALAETHLLLLETRLALNPKLQLVGSFQRDTAGNGAVINARMAWEYLPLSFIYVVFTDTRGAYASLDAPIPEQRVVVKATYTWRP